MILGAYVRGVEREAKAGRARDHGLASLVAIAVNNPRELPKPRDYIEGRKARRFSTEAEINAYFSALSQSRE